jgi:hypothetical protein
MLNRALFAGALLVVYVGLISLTGFQFARMSTGFIPEQVSRVSMPIPVRESRHLRYRIGRRTSWSRNSTAAAVSCGPSKTG